MLKLIRRIAPRPHPRETVSDRRRRPLGGPLVRMIECDQDNLDRLTRALVDPHGAAGCGR